MRQFIFFLLETYPSELTALIDQNKDEVLDAGICCILQLLLLLLLLLESAMLRSWTLVHIKCSMIDSSGRMAQNCVQHLD